MASEENVGVNNKILIMMKIVEHTAHRREAFSIFPLSMCVFTCFPILAITQNLLSKQTSTNVYTIPYYSFFQCRNGTTANFQDYN